ncbi:MAG TPA: asparagine synthase-related protein, partial [Acidobacteriota bacterium]|nr:asparagine synthase-related protein [Acidobacteriota bacterium]
MGGICGIVKWGGAVELWELERMVKEAGYRGVDGFGYWRHEGVGLGSLRHWQTKESYGERDPAQEGLAVVTSDARLDNREELIEALEEAGYRVGEEATDEELILKSYQCWGERSGERLLGDFSFAIWDGVKRRLYGARDAMGMRPFYYREEGSRFLFASEIQQILVQPGVPVRIHELAVGAHLAGVFGEQEWTFYEGIRQLRAGHAVVVEEGGIRTWRYWEAGGGERIRYRREEEYWEHFRELFREAVRCRLRSEKPAGISLSGGMDSGSVASMAGWLRARGEAGCRELRAYCWAFKELKECDEREISDEIVRHYGIALTEVDAEEAWPLKGYPEHGPHRDEPYFGVYQALIEKTLAIARDDG